MNKFLMVMGGIFIAVLLAVGLSIGGFVVAMIVQSRSADAYVERVMPEVLRDGSAEVFLSQAAPGFREAVTDEESRGFFRQISTLGTYQKLRHSKALAVVGVNGEDGIFARATVKVEAVYEEGTLDVDLVLLKKGNVWRIETFFYDSFAFREREKRRPVADYSLPAWKLEEMGELIVPEFRLDKPVRERKK